MKERYKSYILIVQNILEICKFLKKMFGYFHVIYNFI